VPESIDGVLDRAGEDRFAPSRPPVSDRIWKAAVGARIADRSRPMALERGVLTIRAATSVWANELQLLSEPIRERLRERGVRVDELRFRVGAIDPPPRPPERRHTRVVPAPAALPGEIARSLEAVDDLELRETLEAAARANLAWQESAPPMLPAGPPSEGPRGARAPQSSGTGSDPQGRTTADGRADARCTPGAGRDRPR
jgi:hypothetical protein